MSFDVVKFGSSFTSNPKAVELDQASRSVASDEISINDATVDGSLYDLVMKWRRAEQGFEIVEIR